jgi:ribokinase
MKASIAVVGSANMDLVARAPRMPRPGETVIGGDLATVPGGKGANQAVAAARLGADVSFVGRIGDDAFGSKLLRNLSAEGVSTRCLGLAPGAATGVALIIVDDTGQNSIVVAPGANMRLTVADVEAARDVICAASVLLLQLESPMEAVTRAAELAQAHDVTVVLNPAPAQSVPSRLISLIDVIVPNESETAMLTGEPVDTESKGEQAARALLGMGIETVILTLGERGALLAHAGQVERFRAFDVTPVDTTAAGDAFLGAFAVATAEGRSVREAVCWGNAAGALATTRLGAQPSLPSREAVEALLAAARS